MPAEIADKKSLRLADQNWQPLLLLLPLALILLRGANGFAYPSPTAPFSDLTLSHYTNTAFLRDQLFGAGQLPLWAGTILSGYPFAANPLSGMWYPLGWPALVLPLPLAFNLLVGLHLSWGALGLYLLLRRSGLSRWPAVFGGLAFGLLPKLYAHYGAGHLTLMYAVPWTPWLLLAASANAPVRRWRSVLLSGLVLALIFLADVRWAAYAGALWLAWTLWHSVRELRKLEEPRQDSHWGFLFRFAGPLLIALSLAAVLWLPMLEYTRQSTRALMTPAEAFEISLSPAGLLGLIYPPLVGGAHETTLYPGSVTLLLALLAVVIMPRSSPVRFWGIIALAALVFSLGTYLPGFDMLGRLPLVGLLRVPPRALFILGLASAALASHALQGVIDGLYDPQRTRVRLLIVSLLSFTLLVSAFVLLAVRPERPAPFIWGALALCAAGVLLLAGLADRLQTSTMLLALFPLLVLDSGLSGQTMLAYQSPNQVQAADSATAKFLASQSGLFRSYSPSFSLLQHNAYTHNLELAEGVDPLQLAAYATFMESATGVPFTHYSVTLPPLHNGLDSNARFIPDPQLLGLLNVRYLLADFPLPPVDGLQLRKRIGETWVYENLAQRPRAWIEAGQDGSFHAAAIQAYGPNRVALTAEGPGRLVLSEMIYPGWQVRVDGAPAAAETVYGLLRAVDLPSGQHQVEWVFRPTSLYLGAAISALALALWSAAWLATHRCPVKNDKRAQDSS